MWERLNFWPGVSMQHSIIVEPFVASALVCYGPKTPLVYRAQQTVTFCCVVRVVKVLFEILYPKYKFSERFQI